MKMTSALNGSVRKLLVCPRDHKALDYDGIVMRCANRHAYRVIEDIPILVLDDVQHAHWAATRSLTEAPEGLLQDGWKGPPEGVHPFVQRAIGATGGWLYADLIGSLEDYPIPQLPKFARRSGTFLELGCNWGRWSIAAFRSGASVVGIDPSFEAVRAATQVASQLGIDACFLVAEAGYLPFVDDSFDVVFSYSVLQHLAKNEVEVALREARRVLKEDGRSVVQMPNKLGIRCLYHQVKRRFREPREFEVRYWSVNELETVFRGAVGQTTIEVDGFFSLNPQPDDLRLLPWRARLVVMMSFVLTRTSRLLRVLRRFADSVYVVSDKTAVLPTD